MNLLGLLVCILPVVAPSSVLWYIIVLKLISRVLHYGLQWSAFLRDPFWHSLTSFGLRLIDGFTELFGTGCSSDQQPSPH
jgi:hypothetical protein